MKTCTDNHYGTPKPPQQPVPSMAAIADTEPTFHRSGSTGNIAVSGQHPSSDGKRQRNRSNVETSSENKVLSHWHFTSFMLCAHLVSIYYENMWLGVNKCLMSH